MPEKPVSKYKRIPPAVNGLQVNFCKNPKCANFGIPPLESIKGLRLEDSISRPAPGKQRSRDNYTVMGHKDNRPRVECHDCTEKPPLKSNAGVLEEVKRMSEYLKPAPGPTCTNKQCRIHGFPPELVVKWYRLHGTTKAGSKRYRCLMCGKTFSMREKSTLQQRKSHENRSIFMALVNKMPMKRIMEDSDVGAYLLYSRIDFIHRQCLAFAARYERRLPGKTFDRLYISVDRQQYRVNWTNRYDKRNVELWAIGSCDNISGYVFGMHLNFDPSLDPAQVEEDALASGDYSLAGSYRKYARLWLQKDYDQALIESASWKAAKKKMGPGLFTAISNTYAEAWARYNVEVFEEPTDCSKLPPNGMQVHAEYTVYGHFHFLRELLKGTKKLRFFMEQESSMRAGCFAAFHREIMDKRCDAFYIRTTKSLSVDEKQRAVADGKRELKEFARDRGLPEDISEKSLRVLLIEERIVNGELTTFKPFSDRFLYYPAPQMFEPEKMVCYLTELDGDPYSPFHLAKLYSHASLHGIDTFFEQVRRRLSMLERPISPSSNAMRKWYGYSPYNPAMVGKLLDILRVYHNFVLATKRLSGDGKKEKIKRTPAQRLGLIDRPVKVSEILYFVP